MIWTAWIVKKQWMWTLGGGGGMRWQKRISSPPGIVFTKKKKKYLLWNKKKKNPECKNKKWIFFLFTSILRKLYIEFFQIDSNFPSPPPPDPRLFFSLLSFPSAYIFGFFVAVFKCFYFSKTIKALNRGKH